MSERAERVVEAAAVAKQRVTAKLGDIWWAIMLRGLLALALAVSAFVWPEKTLGLFVKLLGGYFLVDGAIGAAGAFRSGGQTTPWMQAIVSLALGLVLLLWTGISAKVFLILVGVWLILQGIGLLSAAFRMYPTDEERGLAMTIGAAMAVIGAVFVFWPHTGAVAISWLVAIGAAVLGALLVYLAARVKNIRHRVNDLGRAS